MKGKYFQEPKKAAPTPTDTKSSGKYFADTKKGKADGQGCIGGGNCYTHDRYSKC